MQMCFGGLIAPERKRIIQLSFASFVRNENNSNLLEWNLDASTERTSITTVPYHMLTYAMCKQTYMHTELIVV